MSDEHIHRNDNGHVLAKSNAEPEIRIAKPHGDFRITKPGENAPHDIGCLCPSCVARRRVQAQSPEFAAIVEARAAKLPPDQADALRRAVFGERAPWWKRLIVSW